MIHAQRVKQLDITNTDVYMYPPTELHARRGKPPVWTPAILWAGGAREWFSTGMPTKVTLRTR